MRLSCKALLSAGLMLVQPLCSAQLPGLRLDMVADLAPPRPAGQGSQPEYFRTVGSAVYFQAQTPLTGFELFRSDGTDGGLELAADIAPGSAGSYPVVVGAAGQRAIVLADDGTGPQFWSVSSAAATQRLTSVNWPVTPTSSTVREVAQAGSRLLWLPTLAGPLWSSDGTTAGTAPVAATAPFPAAAVQGCSLGSRAVVAGASAGGVALGVVDGVAGEFLADVAGTEIAYASYYTPPSFTVSLDSVCYFLLKRSSSGWTLWRSDGTAAGTYEFTSSADGQPAGMQVLQGHLFLLDRVGAQLRLRRSSVAQPAPLLITDNLGFTGGVLDHVWLTAVGDHLLFLANQLGGGPLQLYRSDGSAAGTHALLPANARVSGSIQALPNAVMILVDDVWSAVDVASGAVTALSPFSPGSARLGAVRIGYGTDERGREVWISDGSAAGTRRLHDVRVDNPDGIGRSAAKGITATIGDILYFPAPEYLWSNGWRYGLWRTDGTAAGTRALPRSLYDELSASVPKALGSDLVFSSTGGLNDPTSIFRVKGDFSAASLLRTQMGVFSMRMQRSGDGAAVVFGCAYGQVCGLRDSDTALSIVASGSGLAFTTPIGAVGNVAIFASTSNVLWRSDGTSPGTFVLAEGRKFDAESANMSAAMNGKVYFVTCLPGNSSDCQLTATDGSVAGTGFVHALSMGMTTAAVSLDQRIVFAITASVTGLGQVWSSDGTAAGTQLLNSASGYGRTDVVAAGGYAHVSPVCSSCATPHLVSDGSPAGTYPLQLPAPYAPGSGFLAAKDGVVVFYCRSPASGLELCASDPSGATVVPLPDIAAGPADTFVNLLGQTPGALYIGADDGIHGHELWRLRVLTDAIFASGFQAPN